MVDIELSNEVRQLIEQSLDSVDQLEALLVVRSRPDTFWDAASVASWLGVSSGSVSKSLEELATRNLLDVRIANTLLYRYAPGTDRLAEAIDGLSKVYQERRMLVLQLLMAKPDRPIRAFLDAFRIRKGGKHDR